MNAQTQPGAGDSACNADGLRVIVEGGIDRWHGTFGEFIKMNREAFDVQEVGAIRAIVERGDTYQGGGGAAGEYTVRAAPRSEAQHTPEPWVVSGDRITGPALQWPRESWQDETDASVRVASEIVATVSAGGVGASYRHYPFGVADANKRLIATSPRLLALLKQAAELMPLGTKCRAEWLGRAGAAIAAAEGRA